MLQMRCGDDLYQRGFRGGDAVLSVNEEPVTSLCQAVEAYRKLRNKQEMVLEHTLV